MRARTSVSRTWTPSCRLLNLVGGASFVARYWSSDCPLPQPEVVLPKLTKSLPALSGRAVRIPPVPRACSEPRVPPSAPFCNESLSLIPFRKVSLLLYGSSGVVIWLRVKLFSLPVGQNNALRVPLGVWITTKRFGAAASPMARRALSSGMAAVAASPPRSRLRRVNLSGFMIFDLDSRRYLRPIPEGICLSGRHDQVDDVAVGCGEGLLHRSQRARIFAAFGASGGKAEPLRGDARANLRAVGELRCQLGGTVEGAGQARVGGAQDFTRDIQRLAVVLLPILPDRVVVLESQANRVHQLVTTGAAGPCGFVRREAQARGRALVHARQRDVDVGRGGGGG